MARIVIAGASDISREQLHRLLVSSGYDVFRVCAHTGELRRALSACEDGVVVLCGSVSGAILEDLAADFGESFRFLHVARPEALGQSGARNIFRLSYPCAPSAVIGAVEMLSQLQAMDRPRRPSDEKALIEKAKARLMAREGMTEAEAHRHMQQTTMRLGIKMTDYAAAILRGEDKIEV